jgi:hypothetical protein
MLSVIMLNATCKLFMLSILTLSVITLNFTYKLFMLSVVMLNVVMLSVVILSVIILKVTHKPFLLSGLYPECRYYEYQVECLGALYHEYKKDLFKFVNNSSRSYDLNNDRKIILRSIFNASPVESFDLDLEPKMAAKKKKNFDEKKKSAETFVSC